MDEKKRAEKHERSSWSRLVRGGNEKKHGFAKKCVHFGGFGEGYGGFMGVKRRVLESTEGLEEEGGSGGRAEGSGGSAPPLPGNGAPSPACGSAVVPATREPLPAFAFLLSLVPVLTLATSKVGASSHSYVYIKKKILLWTNTFLFLSGCSDRGRAVPRSALPSVSLAAALCSIFALFLGGFLHGPLILPTDCF